MSGDWESGSGEGNNRCAARMPLPISKLCDICPGGTSAKTEFLSRRLEGGLSRIQLVCSEFFKQDPRDSGVGGHRKGRDQRGKTTTGEIRST